MEQSNSVAATPTAKDVQTSGNPVGSKTFSTAACLEFLRNDATQTTSHNTMSLDNPATNAANFDATARNAQTLGNPFAKKAIHKFSASACLDLFRKDVIQTATLHGPSSSYPVTIPVPYVNFGEPAENTNASGANAIQLGSAQQLNDSSQRNNYEENLKQMSTGSTYKYEGEVNDNKQFCDAGNVSALVL